MPVCFLMYQQSEISVIWAGCKQPFQPRTCQSALNGGSARSIIPLHPCWEKPVRNFGICPGGNAQWTPCVRSSEQRGHASMRHLPPWCHHSRRCSAPSRGPPAQHHKRRPCPPSPAPATHSGGCCFVHGAAGERGLIWVWGEQLLLAFDWVGLCINPHSSGT